MRVILIAIFISFCLGCGSFKEWRHLPKTESDERVIYVVNHGWHTGIIIPSSVLEHQLPFLQQDFLGAKFYEVGWGDKGFYQAASITLGLALNAIFWPTDSVVHIAALPTEPQSYFSNSEIVEVHISSAGMQYLVNWVSESFVRDEHNGVSQSKAGLYGDSAFYSGKGKYYMTNTCNTWVAKALDRAGAPVRTQFTVTAGSIIRQTKRAVNQYRCCGG